MAVADRGRGLLPRGRGHPGLRRRCQGRLAHSPNLAVPTDISRAARGGFSRVAQPAPGSTQAVRADRAHAGVAPASPQVGVTTTRRASSPGRTRAGATAWSDGRRLDRRRRPAAGARDDAGQEGGPGVDGLAQRIQRGRVHTVRSRTRPGHAGLAEQLERQPGGAAVHHDRHADTVHNGLRPSRQWTVRPTRSRNPLSVGTWPASTAGSDGSSSCSTMAAPGTRRRSSATSWPARRPATRSGRGPPRGRPATGHPAAARGRRPG